MIHVQVDAKPLMTWAERLAQGEIRKAVRRAVDQTMTAANKAVHAAIKSDTGLGAKGWGKALGKVRRSTQGSLTASVQYFKRRRSILLAPGAKPYTTKKPASKAFVGMAGAGKSKHGGGGKLLYFRTGRRRLPVGVVFIRTPWHVMNDPGSKSRQAFEETGVSELSRRSAVELQKALDGKASGASL